MYARDTDQDKLVSPYNATLLVCWGAHLNIQKVTSRGFEEYLVKYISKAEPTAFATKEKANGVQEYLEMRVVSSIEAAAVVCGHHFVQSTFNVKFLPTDIDGENYKFLVLVTLRN